MASRLRVTYTERPRYPNLVGESFEMITAYESADHLRKVWRRRRDDHHANIRLTEIEGGIRVEQLGGDDRGEIRELTLTEEGI